MALQNTADGSNVSFALMAESQFGVIPGSPHFKKKRHTGVNFNPGFETQENPEINDTKQGAGDQLVAMSVTGTLPFMYAIGEYDDLEAATLLAGAAVSSTITATGTMVFVAADKTIEGTDAQVNCFANVLPGMYLKVSGTPSENNDGFFMIVQKISNSKVKVYETVVDGTDVDAVIVINSISNGQVRKSFLGEMGYPDAVTATYRLITGIVPSSWTFTLDKKALVSGSFTLMAIEETQADSSVETSSYDAPTIAEVLNSSLHLKNVRLIPVNDDGTLDTAIPCTFSKLAPTMNNGARNVDGIGEGYFPINVGVGPYTSEVACTVYFRDKQLFEVAKNSLSVMLAFQLEDYDGNSKFFCFPKNKIRNITYSTPANQSDLTVDFTLKGMIDDVLTQKTTIITTHMAA